MSLPANLVEAGKIDNLPIVFGPAGNREIALPLETSSFLRMAKWVRIRLASFWKTGAHRVGVLT
jgi:hypothetical protein